ncbi:hypothetical protein [Nocardia lasii]|uniref:ESX secretion-associated protein EspG n=1 Tax=Nocardia lasii TaxID=1616107 RepID=A0ABW1JSQ4_9NOCA
MSWEFTVDEFAHLWHAETRSDRCPFPMIMRSTAQWEYEHERLTAAARRKWPPGADSDLGAALRHAADPASAFTLLTTAGQPIRAYGARTGDHAVLLRQLSSGADHSGNVIVYAGASDIVAKGFASFLGKVPAGRQGPLVEDVDRLTRHFDSWQRPADSTAERMRQLARAPRVGAGHIEARVGLHTSRPHPARYVRWFDVTSDGRYLSYRKHNDLHIEPADTAAVGRAIAALAVVSTG